MEPQPSARRAQLDPEVDRHGHLGDEGPLALRGDVLFDLLLAHGGPLDAQHQLPALGRAQDVVRDPRAVRREGRVRHERVGQGALQRPAGPPPPHRHHDEP